MESDFRAMIDDVGMLTGWQLQAMLHARGASQIAERFGMPYPKVIHAVGTGAWLPNFTEDVYNAMEEGILSSREYERLMAADMIMSGRDRGGRTSMSWRCLRLR